MGVSNLSSIPKTGASVGVTSHTACAASLDTLVSTYITDATGNLAVSLADGLPGQQKIIVLETKITSNMVVTPTHLQNGATITFDATGEVAHLVFSDTEWVVVYTNATVGA